LKTRALIRRMDRTEITPTRIEAEELARRQEEETRAEDKLDLHGRQERAHAKYLAQYPEGHDPLERSLDAYADALGKPREPVKYDPLPEDDDGTAMKSVLDRFRVKIETQVQTMEVAHGKRHH
jgi:hypothetical protein